MTERPPCRPRKSRRVDPATDLEAAWKQKGDVVLQVLRRSDPGAYLAALARLARDVD